MLKLKILISSPPSPFNIVLNFLEASIVLKVFLMFILFVRLLGINPQTLHNLQLC